MMYSYAGLSVIACYWALGINFIKSNHMFFSRKKRIVYRPPPVPLLLDFSTSCGSSAKRHILPSHRLGISRELVCLIQVRLNLRLQSSSVPSTPMLDSRQGDAQEYLLFRRVFYNGESLLSQCTTCVCLLCSQDAWKQLQLEPAYRNSFTKFVLIRTNSKDFTICHIRKALPIEVVCGREFCRKL